MKGGFRAAASFFPCDMAAAPHPRFPLAASRLWGLGDPGFSILQGRERTKWAGTRPQVPVHREQRPLGSAWRQVILFLCFLAGFCRRPG